MSSFIFHAAVVVGRRNKPKDLAIGYYLENGHPIVCNASTPSVCSLYCSQHKSLVALKFSLPSLVVPPDRVI